MRALWSGSISFGLVNIPVKMYSGSQTHHGLDLDLLHKHDQAPIRYARICREDGKEIPWDEIVKGYEYRNGDYVVLQQSDFEKADAEKTHSIDIQQFVDEEDVDVRFFEKPYYLEPGKGADKAYAMLREALERSKKVALVEYVLRARESLGIIKPVGQALVLVQMRYQTDLRDPVDLNLPKSSIVTPAEIKMAIRLIDKETRAFIPEDFHDTYTDKLEDIIEEKAKGKKPKTKGKAPKDTKVKDLMSALKASLDQE